MNVDHEYEAPLAIHCVWNVKDDSTVAPIVERLIALLTRDKLSSFARNLTIPIFKYCSETGYGIPPCIRQVKAKKNICLLFSSLYTAGNKDWYDYTKVILSSHNIKIIGVAVSKEGLPLFGDDNAIRYYDADAGTRLEHCMILIMHEILRWGLVDIEDYTLAKDCSLKIFLSHTKGDGGLGVEYSIALRKCIEKTNMLSFFDATDIGPGYEFKKEIENHLKTGNCALLAIDTDDYASRYWCQSEVLTAKTFGLPIVVLDLLKEHVDRSFPALSNVPVLRITDTSEKNLLIVLLSVIYEVIRSRHAERLLRCYKKYGWIPDDSFTLNRPPEAFMSYGDALKSGTVLCYPDPPVYHEEIRWLDDFGIRAFTPLQCDGKRETIKNLLGKKIGISISDIYPTSFDMQCHPAELKVLGQDTARHILIRGGSLIYGGDLRDDGFTMFLASAAESFEHRECTGSAVIENFLAWPIYVDNDNALRLKAKYSKFINIFEIQPPEDIKDKVNVKTKLLPTNPESRYYWSRCLTVMREESINRSFARICAGGKLSGYNGKMPGVLEEINIALNCEGMPIYLCGGFGGVVGEVCKSLIDGKISETLTEKWQVEQNGGYKSLQEVARRYGHAANYEEIAERIGAKGRIGTLAEMAGLSEEEYRRLMKSPFVDECIHLIMKGLSAVPVGRKS